MDMLINCAGMSVSGKFEDLEVNTFEVSKNLFFDHGDSPYTKSRARLYQLKCVQVSWKPLETRKATQTFGPSAMAV